MNNNLNNIFRQVSVLKYIKKNFGEDIWVCVSGQFFYDNAEINIWSGLFDLAQKSIILNTYSWDINKDSCFPGFIMSKGEWNYHSNCDAPMFEPLLFYRDFYGMRNNCIELSQEFVLFNNLVFDEKNNTYVAINFDGYEEDAVKIKNDGSIYINKKYLSKYINAKQMGLILFFDNYVNYKDENKRKKLVDYQSTETNECLTYRLVCSNAKHHEFATSRLLGKKLIYPGKPPSDNDVLDINTKYCDYIIGIDNDGNGIVHTCNPDKLANNFGKNKDAPHYLTQVVFDIEVLSKYYNNPDKYSVEDGIIRCGTLWSLQVDNHHKNHVIAYLGDLGKELPEREMYYWKSYNVLPTENLSEVSFRRDFLCQFVDSDQVIHKFKSLYVDLNRLWEKKYEDKLYLPLDDKDRYCFENLRIPLNSSQMEFDYLIASLDKVLVDSINERCLSLPDKIIGSINKLETWLKDNNWNEYEEHIKFLRVLHNFKSFGLSHKKGKDYKNIYKKFGVDKLGTKKVFENFLKAGIDYLNYLITNINS